MTTWIPLDPESDEKLGLIHSLCVAFEMSLGVRARGRGDAWRDALGLPYVVI